MNDENRLLREYVERQSQRAFAEIVESRIGLVYAVALRHAGGDAHLAKDVAQVVFTDLARQAPSLLSHPTLGGWLWRAAHHTAVDVVRSERRRRTRELHSELMPAPQDFASDAPGALSRLVDQAMSKLPALDRDLLFLRFYEAKPFSDIGHRLQISENTAHKRVERALQRMERILARAGVTSATGAITAALAEGPALATPAGLSSEIAGHALAAGEVTTSGAGIGSLLGSSKALMAAGAIVVAALIVAVIEFRSAAAARSQATALSRTVQELGAKVAATNRQLTVATQRTRAAEDDVTRLLAGIERLRASGLAAAASDQDTPAKSVHVQLIELPRKDGLSDADLQNQADVILALFRSGESFAALAKTYSGDLHHAKGGDWGWVTPDEVKDEYRKAVFTLKRGAASAPIILPEGCFIFYIAERI